MTLLLIGDLPIYEATEARDAIHDYVYWVCNPPKTAEESSLMDSAFVRLRQAEGRLTLAINGGA